MKSMLRRYWWAAVDAIITEILRDYYRRHGVIDCDAEDIARHSCGEAGRR